MKNDPIWILESNNRGFKVVWCFEDRPQGGRENCNYMILADGLNRQEAVDFANRVRRS